MDKARDKMTGEIVDAEQLWLATSVDKSRYSCPGCGTQVLPAAYGPDCKVKPYFSARATPHQAGCPFASPPEAPDPTKTAHRTSPSAASTIIRQLSFPGRLRLREPLASREPRPALPHGAPSTEPRSVKQNATRRPGAWTASTIRPLCQTFTSYPGARELPLSVPGINGATYGEIFWQLKKNAVVKYRENHLFFAPINWARPDDTQAALEITLAAGDWAGAHRVRPYRVQVLWEEWTYAQRAAIRQEIANGRKSSIGAKERKERNKAWLFFLGCQDENDFSLFTVDDPSLVYCMVADIVYPPTLQKQPSGISG